MAWWLSALGVLAEDPDSVLSTHESQPPLTAVPGEPALAPGPLGHWACTWST